MVLTEHIWQYVSVGGLSDYTNEPSASIKDGEFLD
jgi:hypothetical protein